MVDPGWRGKPQRRRREPLPQPRLGAEARRNVPTDGVDVVPALDQENLDRVTARVARLQTEDAGVLAAAAPASSMGAGPTVADSAAGRAAPRGSRCRTGTTLKAAELVSSNGGAATRAAGQERGDFRLGEAPCGQLPSTFRQMTRASM